MQDFLAVLPDADQLARSYGLLAGGRDALAQRLLVGRGQENGR